MGKTNNEEKLFKTSDLALATFLKLSGLELVDASPTDNNKNKIVFAFSSRSQANTLKVAYFNHKATVDPLEFINQFRNLKAMVSQS